MPLYSHWKQIGFVWSSNGLFVFEFTASFSNFYDVRFFFTQAFLNARKRCSYSFANAIDESMDDYEKGSLSGYMQLSKKSFYHPSSSTVVFKQSCVELQWITSDVAHVVIQNVVSQQWRLFLCTFVAHKAALELVLKTCSKCTYAKSRRAEDRRWYQRELAPTFSLRHIASCDSLIYES